LTTPERKTFGPSAFLIGIGDDGDWRPMGILDVPCNGFAAGICANTSVKEIVTASAIAKSEGLIIFVGCYTTHDYLRLPNVVLEYY